MSSVSPSIFFLLAVSIGMADEPLPAGFDPTPFPEIREIGEIRSQAGVFRLAVDAAMHRSFYSLRLAKKTGEAWQEIPTVLRRSPGPRKSDGFPMAHRVESLEEMPDGSLEIVVGFESPPNGPLRVEIDTPLRDFEKGVSIAVPGTDGAWKEVVSDGLIFDRWRFLDFRHTSIGVPEVNSRTLRLRITDATDRQRSRLRQITRTVGDASGLTVTESSTTEVRAFRINGLRFVQPRDLPRAESDGFEQHPLTVTGIATLPEGKTAIILGGGNLPIVQLFLKTPDRNFRRAVSAQVPGPGDTWRTIHRTHLHRFEVGDFRDENLSLPLPETRAERWRLVIENESNAPVTFPEISAQVPIYAMHFLAEAGDQPVLFLGGIGSHLTNPPNDTAALITVIDREVATDTLSPEATRPNPAYLAAPGRNGLLDSQAALWGIIGIAVAALVAVLYRTMREIEERPEGVE